MYPIDKAVPVAKKTQRRNVYPFPLMEVGDSFFAPGISSGKLSAAASNYANRHGGKYQVAMQEGGTRCWRVE